MQGALSILAFCAVGYVASWLIGTLVARFPRMMENEFAAQCAEYRGEETSSKRYDLFSPKAHCPDCGAALSFLEQLPLIGHLVRHGTCRHCQKPIHWRYFAIELVTILVSGAIAAKFGMTWQGAAALCFAYALIALACIDIETMLLPDAITLPLIWFGVVVSFSGFFTDVHGSILGAIAGYMSLWLLFHAFKLATGKEGMGYGDFKLLAAIGAMLGWNVLPAILLISSLVGGVVGVSLAFYKQRSQDAPIPFGPYLAVAGLIGLFAKDAILHWYAL